MSEYDVLRAQIRQLDADNISLRKRIAELEDCWRKYVYCYEQFGGDDIRTGRAWNLMQRALVPREALMEGLRDE